MDPDNLEFLSDKKQKIDFQNDIKIGINNKSDEEKIIVIDYDIYSIGYKFKKGILEDVYIFSLAGFFLSSMFVLLYAGYKRHFVY